MRRHGAAEERYRVQNRLQLVHGMYAFEFLAAIKYNRHQARSQTHDPIEVGECQDSSSSIQQFSFWRLTGIDLRLELKPLDHEIHQVIPALKDHITG